MKCLRSAVQRGCPMILLETLGREHQRRTAPHPQKTVRCFRVFGHCRGR